jgi:hypothetical protein
MTGFYPHYNSGKGHETHCSFQIRKLAHFSKFPYTTLATILVKER